MSCLIPSGAELSEAPALIVPPSTLPPAEFLACTDPLERAFATDPPTTPSAAVDWVVPQVVNDSLLPPPSPVAE